MSNTESKTSINLDDLVDQLSSSDAEEAPRGPPTRARSAVELPKVPPYQGSAATRVRALHAAYNDAKQRAADLKKALDEALVEAQAELEQALATIASITKEIV